MENHLAKLHNAVSAPVTAIRDALAERLQSVRDITSLLHNRMKENMGYGQQETLKDIVEKEAEEGQQQEQEYEDDALKPKTDVDSYLDQAKPYIKTLIEKQLKEMGSPKIIMTLWVLWKKPIKPPIKLGPDNTIDDIYYEKINMPFNSLMTEFFDASDINNLIERMLAYIKAQNENPKFLRVVLRLIK